MVGDRQRRVGVLLDQEDRDSLLAQIVDRREDFLDQHLGRRGAGGDAEARDAAKYRPVDVAGAVGVPADATKNTEVELLMRCFVRLRRTDDMIAMSCP